VWMDRIFLCRENLVYGWAMTILLDCNTSCRYLHCGTDIYDWSLMMKCGCSDIQIFGLGV
jgi:hypothetical protein